MTHDRGTSLHRTAICTLIAAALCAAPMADARAHYTPYNNYPNGSDASALSLLPVAVSVAAPVAILSAGAVLTIVAVQASAEGTVWVLERASDGARASVNLSANAAIGLGTAVMVTAVSAGWVLSAAGEAIAFIPNELGGALLYNERISR